MIIAYILFTFTYISSLIATFLIILCPSQMSDHETFIGSFPQNPGEIFPQFTSLLEGEWEGCFVPLSKSINLPLRKLSISLILHANIWDSLRNQFHGMFLNGHSPYCFISPPSILLHVWLLGRTFLLDAYSFRLPYFSNCI